MSQSILRRVLFLSIFVNGCLILFIGLSFFSKEESVDVYGEITVNEESAKSIAEIISTSHYGERVKKYKPFVAELKDSVWYVQGTLNRILPGAPRIVVGVPHIEINSSDGKILNFYHTK